MPAEVEVRAAEQPVTIDRRDLEGGHARRASIGPTPLAAIPGVPGASLRRARYRRGHRWRRRSGPPRGGRRSRPRSRVPRGRRSRPQLARTQCRAPPRRPPVSAGRRRPRRGRSPVDLRNDRRTTSRSCAGSPPRAPSRSTTWSHVGARIGERARDGERIVAVGRLASEVALAQPDDATAPKIDRRKELEGRCTVLAGALALLAR